MPDPEFRRPLLARQARYRWDPLRREHQLVFAEGVLILNETGAAIAQRCDGRPIEELIADLAREFESDAPQNEVREFLARLTAKGLLREAEGD